MVFTRTRKGGAWGQWRYGSTQWHRWGPSRHRGSWAFETCRILQFVVGSFRAGFWSEGRQYYGSLLRSLGLNSVVIIEVLDCRVVAGSPAVFVRHWFRAFMRTFGARWKWRSGWRWAVLFPEKYTPPSRCLSNTRLGCAQRLDGLMGKGKIDN